MFVEYNTSKCTTLIIYIMMSDISSGNQQNKHTLSRNIIGATIFHSITARIRIKRQIMPEANVHMRQVVVGTSGTYLAD